MKDKPFSQACENNKGPILEVLSRYLEKPARTPAQPGGGRPTLLEIGSGTGQHAAFLGRALAHIHWQPSDVRTNLPGIHMWVADAPDNVAQPLELDVDGQWPDGCFDHLFTANTLHIMSQSTAARCLQEGAARLKQGGLFFIYGPFNYGGDFTSQSNREFDAWLRQRNAASGIRDREWVVKTLTQAGMSELADHAMPANNRLLVFQRRGVL